MRSIKAEGTGPCLSKQVPVGLLKKVRVGPVLDKHAIVEALTEGGIL